MIEVQTTVQIYLSEIDTQDLIDELIGRNEFPNLVKSEADLDEAIFRAGLGQTDLCMMHLERAIPAFKNLLEGKVK